MQTEEIEIPLAHGDLHVEVTFGTYGSHLAETRYEQAESPIIEIESIIVQWDDAEGGYEEGYTFRANELDDAAVEQILWDLKADRDADFEAGCY